MKTKFLMTILSSLMVFGAQAQVSVQSKKIAAGVKVIKVAANGFEIAKVKPNQSIKSALIELALKKGYIDKANEISWVGGSSEAWEADSTNFGSATMRDAFEYIKALDEDLLSGMEPKEKAKLIANVKTALKGFKLLLNTGVQFGVVPFGAVQCGITLAALAIYDPHSGVIYILNTEESGSC